MTGPNNERPVYAERMFPAPVDLGHRPGRPGRVVNVSYGTSAYLEGEGGAGKLVVRGRRRRSSERAVQSITIYPPTRGLQTQGDPFEPVKIGILVDMDLGQLLADWIDPTILAIEDALNEGVWGRGPVQLVIADAAGLPRENYRKVIDGYRWLVEQGCVVVLGPMISDNSLALQDTANELGVPCIGWTGAHKFASRVLLHRRQRRHPDRGRHVRAMAAASRGIDKVGLFWEAGLVGQATTPTTSATPRCSSA